MAGRSSYGYGKRPLWQWVVIYLVIGAIVYGLLYYFIIAKRSTYSLPGQGAQQSTPSSIGY